MKVAVDLCMRHAHNIHVYMFKIKGLFTVSISDCDSDFRGLLALAITIHSEQLVISDFLLNSIQIANR